ncbi:MAG: homoserine kinase [Firmicutes bacterium]|nr:homoserine kinase [Bacillota bacterium]MDD3851889.1 homoserine kinase [Bacillota bacterium]MDD4708209.1 homoserine kinase [Bacillota bacterium]
MYKVRVPATSANMGPGFDCMGIALDIYNTVEVHEIPEGLIIENHGRDADLITKDGTNLIYRAMERVFRQTGFVPTGLKIISYNDIPVARGLGSSAASTAAGLLLANALIGEKLDMKRIIELGTALEGHPDNIVPALIGGMTLSYAQDTSTVGYIKLDFPEKLRMLVMVPDFLLSTAMARKVLPRQVELGNAVFNVSRAALMVAALTAGELDHLKYAVQDKLHQPYREKLIPGMQEVFQQAYNAGARGVFLSGAGSTLIALVDADNNDFLSRLKGFLDSMSCKWELKYADISRQGAARIQ